MGRGHTRFLFCARSSLLAALWLTLFLRVAALAQQADRAELSDEEQRQVAIAERFLSILEKNPRRGTALDRIYGHHVEFGTLDPFMASIRQRVENDPKDGTGWMLLGLFEAHRGNDAAAIDAFRRAEKHRVEDALASYYLGQSLLLLGQPDEAVDALERAIGRKPPRVDLLEIFQQLGRVHQRAHRTEKAMKTWERLETLFPDDARVQEQIAVVLVEEGEYTLALPRYERLAKLVRDDYRRTMFRIEIAGLKIRENRREEGLADLETLLGDLNPESWLHRDVRRRIEEVFLRSGDQDGLVAYYEKWLQSHPDDVDGMARLARFLASSARIPEATQWLEKALKRAPTRTELRKAFIDQLVDDGRYGEACQQYELLVESAPGNPDFLRDWGKLVARNKDLDGAARKAEAARIWQRILAAHPDDALTTAQVADLFRQSKMNDEALELYQKAVEQAPNDPQYREYLGEFYHILKRREEALATWASVAEGDRRTALNVARLAEIYNSFGYLDEAIEQIGEACRLDPKDFSLQLKAAEYHSRGGKFDEALAFLDAAEKMAANEEERETIVSQRIDVFRSSRRLDDEIEALATAVHQDKDASAESWHLLARYCAADSRWTEATEAVEKALGKDGKSTSILATSAKIAELSGDYARAAESNRQLAAVDRRSRSEHLMNVARLEAQMGRTDEALQAGEELLVAAPGNTDNYEFYARLCFQLGRSDQGIDLLRKAVRINSSEPHLIMALGAALAEQFRADEAIEVYWRAFEKTDDLDDRTSLTMKLTDLYLQRNQFEKLLERLERLRQEEDHRREMTICLAQAHQTSGDYGTARQELESLLSEDTRDTNLLQQLSKLCEDGSDTDAAIDYQRQLVAIAPGHESEYRLAQLLQSSGEWDEAGRILQKLMQREEDPVRRLRNIDSLLSQGAHESVLALTEPLLNERRDDWELLYREGVAWESLDKPEEARDRFERLLALAVAHDELGVVATDRFKQAQAKARSNNLRGIHSQMPARPSPFSRLSMSTQIRRAVGLDSEREYYSAIAFRRRSIWTPDSFGDARMAAYAWLLKFDENTQDEAASPVAKRLEALAQAAAADDAGRETLYDWMYVEQLRGNRDSIFRVARRLARDGGVEEQQFFLTSLTLRHIDAQTQRMPQSSQGKVKREPLPDEDLELMLQCFEGLAGEAAKRVNAKSLSGQIAYGSNGQVYIQVGGNWVPVSGFSRSGVNLQGIVEELKLAGRQEQADQLVREELDSAKTASEHVAVMSLLFEEERYEEFEACLPKWLKAAREEFAKGNAEASGAGSRSGSSAASSLSSASRLLVNWMGHVGAEEEHEKLVALLDQAFDLDSEIARANREQRRTSRRPSSANVQMRTTRLRLKYGKEDIQARFDYPTPNTHLDTTGVTLLREIYEIFQRNDVLDDLPAHLEQRLKQSPESGRLHATLALAAVRWWMDEKDEALVLLKQAGALLNDDPEFRLQIAMLLQARGDLEDALEVVDSIVPREAKLVQQRELMALQFAERVGDIERARQAAERLFGVRMDNATQLSLIEPMRRLGMQDMAEAIVSRVRRRSGRSLSSLGTLMTMYQGQGKVDQAQQMAHTILRRTKPLLSNLAISGMRASPYGSGSSDSRLRTQALRLLHQTGGLKEMIGRLEGQLERSPNSPRLCEQLVEYFEAAGEREKASDLLARTVEAQPDAMALRVYYAKSLESAGKLSEACDQYVAILQCDPAVILDDFYKVRRLFERAERSIELIKAVENMNLKAFPHPYYLVDLLSDLMRNRGGKPNKEQMELALNLCERVFEAFPEYRSRLISRMYDENVWTNDRVFALGKKAILPSAREADSSPWFGLDNIYSYSSGGRVNSQFNRMLEGVHDSKRLPELRKAVEERLVDIPEWRGGQAMLALIDLKEDHKEEAKERLKSLVSDDATLETMPDDTCWLVGQELDQFEDTRDLALKLFEVAAEKPSSMTQIEYSPTARLIELYRNLGRMDDAKKLLDKQLSRKSDIDYDDSYLAYVKIENSVWAGQQYLKLECPVEAVRIFRAMADDDSTIEMAGRRYSGRADYFQTKVKKGLNDATAALGKMDADDAMAQLLSVAKEPHPGSSALDLMLAVPEMADVRTKAMESPLIDLLAELAKEPAVAQAIYARLADLRQRYPADLSIPVVDACLRLRTGYEHRGEAVQTLVDVVAEQPLEEIKSGRRPNGRQRREALTQVPIWLAARECLKTPEQRPLGDTLAARALDAARRQSDDRFTASVLYDWGKTALEEENREGAEAKWSGLLEIVTHHPRQKKSPATPKAGPVEGRPRGNVPRALPAATKATTADKNAAPRIPPLTISEFRLTMEIALAAAENGMADLSRKAVRVGMRGGTPVADLDTSSYQPGNVTRYSAAAANSPDSGASQGEAEVAEKLRDVIARWQGGAYPPEEVYDLLASIVFPANRLTEILLYADSSKLREAEAHSLGALLVRHAKLADRWEDLAARIEACRQNPQAQVPVLVLEVWIAIARERIDEAKTALVKLAKVVQEGALPAMVQLACHAALPATEHEALEEPAYAILKAALKLEMETSTNNRSSDEDQPALGALVARVNRYLADRPEQVNQFYDNYLASRQDYYSRYSGTYGQYLQWKDWATIAEEAAKVGASSVALDYLGRVADFSYERYSRPSTTTALAVVCREMDQLSPVQRYEAWRDWTLPVEGRQTVRLTADWIEPVRVPQRFLNATKSSTLRCEEDFLCNFTELLASAEAVGRLEELRTPVQQAHEQKLENATLLYALLLIRLGDVEAGGPVVKGIIDTAPDRLKRESGKPRPEAWGDYLVYRACLQSPEFVKCYQSKRGKLTQALRSLGDARTLARLNVDFALRAGQGGAPTVRPGDDPLLAHWLPATTREAAPSGVDPWWVTHEGHIAHLTGAGSDLLYFAYPVTGEFEFTIEGYDGSWAETDLGYGGVMVEGQDRSRASVWAVDGHESYTGGRTLQRKRESFGTLTIRVADGKMQYIRHNHVCHEEELSDTSPWLTLYTYYPRSTTLRNPRFRGTPIIPREVRLVKGDRMDGWNCTHFSETQPRRRIMSLTPKNENDSISRYQQQEPAEFDWQAKDSQLLGRAREDGQAGQSWIYYHRPLRDGESFRYEFYYTPGNSVAHPTIGRVALLLEPAGVAEHWITRPDWDAPVLGLADDNRLAVTEARRGPGSLPLKPGDWNEVVLTLKDRTLQVTLNSQQVYERALEAEIDGRFGMFRHRNESLKVRAPVLTGPWPGSLTPEIADDLLASTRDYSPADRQLFSVLLTDRFFSLDAAQVVAEARELPPQKAYEKLCSWVLTSPDHVRPRLYFELTTDENGDQTVLCPACELMAVADGIGKLPDLEKAIDALTPRWDVGRRAKIALAALAAMQGGKVDVAKRRIAELYDYAKKGFPKEMGVRERCVDWIVAWEAAKNPALEWDSLDLANELQNKNRDSKHSAKDGNWAKWLGILVGHVGRAMSGGEEGPASPKNLTQWAAVPYEQPALRGRGYGCSEWFYLPGIVQHVTGGSSNQLFFQSPLEGDFEIEVERSLHGHREVAVAYSMLAAEPRYDFKATRLVTLMGRNRDLEGEVKIPNERSWLADFRIVVRGKRVSTFVKGVPLHEETFAAVPAPWLVLQAANPFYASTVRNLRILGSPKIPDEIDLIATDRAAWRADVYDEYISTTADDENAPWKIVDGELRGQLRKDMAARHCESLLLYQRPMLEDGVIEFEAFYEPGQFEVHPTLGRTALIVGPDGVRKHILTDAQYETSGLLPDNVFPVEGAAERVELKEKDWNHYRLTLRQDRLTLAVNGSDVAAVTVAEPPCQRHFGLFRYGDKTQCRVRNLVYRGEWPTTLPPVSEQQLARPVTTEGPGTWSEPTVFELKGPQEGLKTAGLVFTGPADRILDVDCGKRMLLREAADFPSRPRLRLPIEITGDWMVTLDFEDLRMAPAKEGWGSNFSLRAAIGPEIYTESGVGMEVSGLQTLKCNRRHKTVLHTDWHESRRTPVPIEAGRFRLIRSGPIVSACFAEKGSDKFRFEEMYSVGDAPLREFSVECSASDADAVIDVVVTKLTVQTRENEKE